MLGVEQFVPVTEDLPEELDEEASDDVLVLLDDLTFAVGFFDYEAKGWASRFGFELTGVTHWTPLPQVA